MIRLVFFSAVLLSCLTYHACNTPSEQPTKMLQDQPQTLVVSTTDHPDTAGLFQAYQVYAEKSAGSIPLLSPSSWRLLSMIGGSRGMIPLSIYLDDSTGFDALFFRRELGEFQFYTISSLTGRAMEAPLLPEVDGGKDAYEGR